MFEVPHKLAQLKCKAAICSQAPLWGWETRAAAPGKWFGWKGPGSSQSWGLAAGHGASSASLQCLWGMLHRFSCIPGCALAQFHPCSCILGCALELPHPCSCIPGCALEQPHPCSRPVCYLTKKEKLISRDVDTWEDKIFFGSRTTKSGAGGSRMKGFHFPC